MDAREPELTANALRVLEARYLRRDGTGRIVETPLELFERVARAVSEAELLHASAAAARQWEERFLELLTSLLFLPNSPTLMNAGTPLGQLAACFVLPVDDTMESIFGTLRDMALVQRTGGGTGFSFSRLRPAGEVVASTGGVASGPVSFMKIYDAATEHIKLGGRRRGANMGVLRVDHPDVEAFINAKRDGVSLRNFNLSVAVTDAFMAAVEAGDELVLRHPRDGREVGRRSARALFEAICDAAWATGDPGLLFLDRINRDNPLPALGQIESTNPCVTGETLIYTDGGLRRAADLAASAEAVRVVVADRDEPLPASRVFRTRTAPVFRLETADGYTVRLTGDHRVRTQRGWVPAAQLQAGDEIYLLPHRGGFGTGGSAALGRILGWMVGHDTVDVDGNRAVLRFYGTDRVLAPSFAADVEALVREPPVRGKRRTDAVVVTHDDRRDVSQVRSVRLAHLLRCLGMTATTKLAVPEAVFTGSEEMQRGFLQALFTADGHVTDDPGGGGSVRLTSVSPSLLLDVQRLLLNFGIVSRLDRTPGPAPAHGSRVGGEGSPDGRGGHAAYRPLPYHELHIARANLAMFAETIGFLREDKQRALAACLAAHRWTLEPEPFTARFAALIPDGEETVYDLSEPVTHSFVANGIVVHNCGEVPLLPYEACNLGSINLARLVVERDGQPHLDWERLRALVHDAVRFLDDVITVSRYPLGQTTEIVQANRKIGLGVMGFAEMLIRLGVSYAEAAAVRIAADIASFMAREARAASARLAEERGPFPNWEKSGYVVSGLRLRNATLLSIAPTGTLSIIAGTSSGIEPLFALAYHRSALDGRVLTEWNPLALRELERRGLATEDVVQGIARSGRLASVPGIPEDLRRLFVTALEIPPEQHVRIQAAFQSAVDNAVSKTVNLPHEATPTDIANVYRLAHRLGCKGITVFRYGSTGTQVLELGAGEEPYEREHFVRCDPEACKL